MASPPRMTLAHEKDVLLLGQGAETREMLEAFPIQSEALLEEFRVGRQAPDESWLQSGIFYLKAV